MYYEKTHMEENRSQRVFRDIRPPEEAQTVSDEREDFILDYPDEMMSSPIKTIGPSNSFRFQKPHSKKFLWWIILILSVLAGLFLFFLVKKIHWAEKRTVIENRDFSLWSTVKNFASSDAENLNHTDPNRLNILLLGLAGEHKPGNNLTDTIIIMSIDLSNHRVALISLPRDLYVKIPDSNIWNKINTVYQYGLSQNNHDRQKGAELISQSVSEITGLPIDYFLISNFQGFTDFIDAIGGVDIMNERDLLDAHYPGPNYSYETFSLAKGFHHLDGATALKYARERHADPEGDFGRAKRQQQIMESAKRRFFSSGTLFNPWRINNILEAIGNNFSTNIQAQEVGSFWSLAKTLDTQNINNIVVDAWKEDSPLKVSHIFSGDKSFFILVPRAGNWSEVRELAKNAFDLDAIQRERQAIKKENSTIGILNESGYPELTGKIIALMKQKWDYQNVFSYPNYSQTNSTDDTVIYDATQGATPFTLNELSEKLPARITYGLPVNFTVKNSNKPDILIILGKDIASHYLMATDSLDDLKKSEDQEDDMEINNP